MFTYVLKLTKLVFIKKAQNKVFIGIVKYPRFLSFFGQVSKHTKKEVFDKFLMI
jgi:hypothetical protein